MSSDLLAEFDSFYRAPQDSSSNPPASASNDLSVLDSTTGNGQSGQGSGFSQWQSPSRMNNDIWGDFPPSQPATKAQSTITQHDDIWSSFEAAPPQSKPPTLETSASRRPDYGAIATKDFGGSTRQSEPIIMRKPTLEIFSSILGDVEHSSPKPPGTGNLPPPKQPASRKSSHGDVLFDATEELSPQLEDDDEFGEFETVSPESSFQPALPPPSQSLNTMFNTMTLETKSAKAPVDLLSISTSQDHLPYPQAPKSASFKERNPFGDLGLSTKQAASRIKEEDKPKTSSPVTAWPTFEPNRPKPSPYKDSSGPADDLDDEWGDFADLPPETPTVTPVVKAPSSSKADTWAWDAVDQVTEPARVQVDVAPPTNIPPPSVLLALFPSLFDLPQSTLFKPVANQSFSLKNRIISDPSTIDFLRAYLLIAVVAARIIAGRKLRWKRDTLLSQAMKIGPAAAGGKGGMKLAGVDKAEVAREDREAADVVRIWKDQLGRLRSAVAVANSSMRDSSRHLAIPDISEAMPVKSQQGGLTAPKPCLICGLKREERVNKVDVDVDDSFGEWWVDHWGHRACRNFWLEHESKLKSR
ncbi:hypothetical protein M430DRAFT_19239 [Amorphotheca resinae ATCC 22711]|uniref:Serine/threonine-protein kinase ppk6 n=1 Tax=Amorphotheca resinae ATCC 22711 TaxID=857342 RepID=A0A2T3B267_AMORE|nr:hypothetical protein M430DRAFT_19239 [Amorphotheca resinae ATCC 22711]PSS18639.1 hypothetical protein M430DRAFT_19239 [Amorphotheca resinae ATCC 22711]